MVCRPSNSSDNVRTRIRRRACRARARHLPHERSREERRELRQRARDRDFLERPQVDPVGDLSGHLLVAVRHLFRTDAESVSGLPDEPLELRRDGYVLTTDRKRIPLDQTLALLHTTFWANTLSRDQLERAMQNSVCFGVLADDRLVGFAR